MNFSALKSALAVALIVIMRTVLFLPFLLTSAATLRGRKSHTAPAWSASPLLWEPAADDVELSVVIPFYNPGDAMRPTIERLVNAMREQGVRGEVIAVSDGSTDGSEKTIEGMAPEVNVIIAEQNAGKGAALHRGFAHARGSYVGFVDCDGDIDPIHLLDYLEIARHEDRDVVYASKREDASQSDSSFFRKTVSLGFSTFVRVLFPIHVTDTQTGCKVFSRAALAEVLPRLREQRFAFDLEFFVAATAAGITNLRPAPVALGERLAGSTVTAKSILRTMLDAFAVFGRLHLTRTYQVAAAGATSALVPAIAEPMPSISRAAIPFLGTNTDLPFFGRSNLEAA